MNTESQSIRKFKDTFESFVDYSCYQNKYDRIVFFIDDLDRIDPRRAVELMEIIKIIWIVRNVSSFLPLITTW